MKFLHIRKYFLVSFCVLLITTGLAFAVETFQNNLLKIDVYQSSLGGVKITLYTSKPYTDPINVIKKTDLDYVIFMPETSSSLSAKPILKPAEEVIKNIDIKTQPYENQMKGYTKIIISTTKATTITPQVQTLNAALLSKNEVTVPKKTVTVKEKTPPMPPALKLGENKPQAKKVLPVKKELSKQELKQTKHKTSYESAYSSKRSATKYASSNYLSQTNAPVAQKVKTSAQKSSVKINKPKTAGTAKPSATQKTKTSVASPLPKTVPAPIKTAPVAATKSPTAVPKATPKAIPTATVPKATPTAVKPTLPPTASVDKTAQPQPAQPEQIPVATKTEPQTPTPQANVPPAPQSAEQTATVPQPTQVTPPIKPSPFADGSIYPKIGYGIIAILLLLLLARAISKSGKKRQQQNADFINNSPTPPIEAEQQTATESFSEDMASGKNWREKYKSYVASENPPENKTEETIIEPEPEPKVEFERPQPQEIIFEDTTAQENPEINAEENIEEVVQFEQPEFEQPEFEQPEFEQPLSQITEEYNLEEEMPEYQVAEPEKQEGQWQQAQQQEEEMEEETSLLDELDEILAQGDIGEQTASVEEIFAEEAQGTISPLDSLEIRREMDEAPTKSIEEMTEEYQRDLTPLEEIPAIDYEENTVLEIEEPQEEVELLSLEEPVEILAQEPVRVEEQTEEEIIKSEFAIDKDKGFYLVDVEDSSALVGHIKDKIFVLKQFDQKIQAPLQARLDEQKDGSSNYMAKVGSFRGLVEVTKKEMNLLIEL